MDHFFMMFGLLIALLILFFFLLFSYQKSAVKKQNERGEENNGNDSDIEDSENIENDEAGKKVKYSPKILTVPVTAMACVLGLMSAVNFAAALMEIFSRVSSGAVYKILSLLGSSFYFTSAVGLLYVAAAAVFIFGAPKRALRLLSLAACVHVISFLLNFLAFGHFCDPLGALRYVLISVPVIIVTGIVYSREAFELKRNELFWQDVFFIFVFLLLIFGGGGTIRYFGDNYPYSRGVWPDEDFRSARPDANAGDTVEIYGLAFRIPRRFEIARAEHVEAGGTNSASGYDTAVFSDGSGSVSIVTRGGMPAEQLFEKTNIFNVLNAREYSEKFIYEPSGIIFLAVKAKAEKYYNRVITNGWTGYAEQPAAGIRKTPVWSFNLWSTDENALNAVRISFKFKDAEDVTGAVKLVDNVISSLIVGRPEKTSVDPLKLATAEIALKNYASAKIYLAGALAGDYKNADAHYYMALCLYSGNFPDSAAVNFHLDRALQSNPSHSGALDLMAKLRK